MRYTAITTTTGCKLMEIIATIDKRNGDLVLTVSLNDQHELQATLEQDDHDSHEVIMVDLMEHYMVNGSYHPFDAGHANPFVGLTDAPCIAEDMDFPDGDTAIVVGRLWWFPGYEVEDPLTTLADTGTVTYTLAPA